MDGRWGDVLILPILVISLVCSATSQIDTTSSEAAPYELADRLVTSLGFDSVGCRPNQIMACDAELINLLFSYSCAQVLLAHVPISSWQQLYNITYTIASTERRACKENQALALRLLFDLSGAWPWPNEARISGLVPGTGNAPSVINSVIESRRIDDYGFRDKILDSGDHEVLSLFFDANDQILLRNHMPITSWETLHSALPVTMPDLKAAILHILFDLSGEWPWRETTRVVPTPLPLATPEPSQKPDLRVSWECRWSGDSSDGIYVNIEVEVENRGTAVSTGTYCWFGLEESFAWFYAQTDFREFDIPPGGSVRYDASLWVPFGVWTRLVLRVRNDQGDDIREESSGFYTG